MTCTELKGLLARCGLSQRGAARSLEIHERTMRKYISGEAAIPRTVELALRWLALQSGRAPRSTGRPISRTASFIAWIRSTPGVFTGSPERLSELMRRQDADSPVGAAWMAWKGCWRACTGRYTEREPARQALDLRASQPPVAP